jgi:hypothetical protein
VAITLCGPAFQQVHLASGLVTLLTRSCNPTVQARWFRLFRFRSPLLSESRLIYFPPGTEMVHFPGLARTRLCIQRAVSRVHRHGFPHSEIPGSKPACGSPGLIAASHVLLRLLAPRHPPYALSSLTIKLTRHVAHTIRIRTRVPRGTKNPFPADGATVQINSPFHNLLYSSRTCGLNASRAYALRRPLRHASTCQLFSCQRALVPRTARTSHSWRDVRKFPNQIKNPASSAGPNRLHRSAQAGSRDARLSIIRYS